MRVTLYPIPLKVSGAQTDRPELAKLLKCLGRGEVLMVTRLDRLARSRRNGNGLAGFARRSRLGTSVAETAEFLMRNIAEIEAKAAELQAEPE